MRIVVLLGIECFLPIGSGDGWVVGTQPEGLAASSPGLAEWNEAYPGEWVESRLNRKAVPAVTDGRKAYEAQPRWG